MRRALQLAEPSAFLAEPRVIRRVIRERHGFVKLSTAIPHADSQLVPAAELRELVHPDELGLADFLNLPETCLLISQPAEDELQHWPVQELLQQVWRRLFHAVIDRELQRKLSGPSERAEIQRRIAGLGQVAFDEAHFVLRSETRLVDPESRTEAWREFCAMYLELRWFEPDLLKVWFPSLTETRSVDVLLESDVAGEQIFEKTRLYGATSPDLTTHLQRDEERLVSTRREWFLGAGSSPSDRAWLRASRRRERARERGNTVGAIVSAMQAAQRAVTEDKRQVAVESARQEIRLLVERLQRAISFTEHEAEEWRASLWELATNAIHGFWNSEKRLLFDLQKVCLDNERVNYKVDLVTWLASRGARPLRRPLHSLREVLMTRHLSSAEARLVHVRLSGAERDRLTKLLHEAAHQSELQMRDRMRPVLQQTLRDVGLVPRNVPEQTALDKLVDDALDCIVSRGYLTLGYLRDSISRNDLKLPDLTDMRDLWQGDYLLRADDRLALSMDGVYQRGEFYLRWLQTTSSIFFGNRAGRFATLFLLIPFGGALVIVEGVRHLAHLFHRKPATPAASGDSDQSIAVQSDADKSDADKSDADKSDADKSAVVSGASAGSASAVEVQRGAALSERGAERSGEQLTEVVGVSGGDVSEGAGGVVTSATDTATWVLGLGFLLMALIHLTQFRRRFFRLLRSTVRLLKVGLIEYPLRIARLPLMQAIWRHRAVVRFRRVVVVPGAVAWLLFRAIPGLLLEAPPGWLWFLFGFSLCSLALNSRPGRDAQELTSEWLANAWHKLQARIFVALLDLLLEFFRMVLNLIERFLYAVDEWLRFHSEESWLSIVVKAVLGVVWSFVSFLIRIYVNLLIEPTFHPVKHFPVVTVAHKMILPGLVLLQGSMVTLLQPYLGRVLAESVTWFNIFFIPGIFGFAVWELKENWRLYASNRRPRLMPVAVGSHGETVARLLRPGFYSGTLPKIFRRRRRLELQQPSFRRFSMRRSVQSQLDHVQEAIRNFVKRDLIRVLQLCPVWAGTGIRCARVSSASNSFLVDIECPLLGEEPIRLLFQEQSGWVVAGVDRPGCLRFASADQLRSLQHALEGFYRKCGIDMVREQLESAFVHDHPYDINGESLVVWPGGDFRREIVALLVQKRQLRPLPAAEAQQAGLLPTDRQLVIFNESGTVWSDWIRRWETGAQGLPQACLQAPGIVLLLPAGSN
ncbi:MAG: APC family permease [Planctomyces sp.]|nr:APC family permease [Planctomyces sp.]